MLVSPFLYRVENIIFNYLNGEYISFYDFNHPFLKILDKGEFSKEAFIGYEEDLDYLIENKFILDEDVEKFYKKHLWSFLKSKDLHLVLMPAGTNCNFRCKYCYQNHKDKYFTKEDIKNIVKFINNSSANKVQLDFFGGEPLLNKEGIFEILDLVEKDIIGSMTTNGYLLDFETFENLVKKRVKIFQVTIDGYKEMHDFLRPLSNEKGTFERIIRNLENITNSKEEFNIIFRVNFNEKFDIEKFIDFIKTKKFFKDNRFMYLFRPIESGWNESYNNVNCKINSTIRFDFYEKIIKIGLIPADYMLLSKNSHSNFYCPSGKENYFVITPGGILKKCTVALDNPKNVVGVLKNGEIILNENYDLWLEKELYPKEECKNCNLLTLCGGKMCPLNRIENNKIQCIDIKDKQKKVIKNLVKFRESFN